MLETSAHRLTKLFNPESVVIIGASSDRKKIGNIVLRNIIESGYKGHIALVNPHAKSIYGIPVTNDIFDLKHIPDLAIISIPSQLAIIAIENAAKIGIKNYVVFSAGFKETGHAGKLLEEKLENICNKYKLNLLGPNCMGFVNHAVPINATFGNISKQKGKLRFVSQSGALAASFFDYAKENNIGISECITLGNKLNINEIDVLSYFDNKTNKPIGMYLESISGGKEFMYVLNKHTKTSPVFVLKPGKSIAAKQAMQSHTGAIASESRISDTAIKQTGAILTETIQDFFDLAMLCNAESYTKTGRIAVVSNAGGPAVVTTDIISNTELELAKLSEKTQKVLEKHLSRNASLLNPIDILGDAPAKSYEVTLKAILNEKNIDGALVILTPQVMTQPDETAKIISELSDKYKKTIVCAFMGGTQTEHAMKVLALHNIPAYRFPERAIYALNELYKWQNNKTRISRLSTTEPSINIPEYKQVNTFGECVDFIRQHDYPVVLKTNDPKVLHKTDKHLVYTNIYTHNHLDDAFTKLSTQTDQIIIQKQISNGIELIVGIKTDKDFGKVLMFGSGGIYTEILHNQSLRVLPLTQEAIYNMIYESQVYTILNGYRGNAVVNIDSIVSAILWLYEKMQMENIKEIEINPLIATAEKAWAVDTKIIM